MESLIGFALNEEYKRVERLGDKLAEIESLIDWEAFRPIVADMYDNRSKKVADRDRGYSATMRRGARDHPISIRDAFRNRRISKKRAPAERHYAVIKRLFHATHVLVTTVTRVNVKMIFIALGFNLYQLYTLRRLGIV
jgi:IS5 family transposase